MTKAQLKEKYKEWNQAITALEGREEQIFHELQELCLEKGDGHRWCSIHRLAEELIKKGRTHRTMQLVAEYYEICGRQEALRDLAIATNNFEI